MSLASAAWLVLIVGFIVADRPLTNMFLDMPEPPANPTGALPIPETAINVIWLALTATSVIVGAGSLITRWRTADRELRHQLMWVLYAFGVAAAVVAINLANTILMEAAGIDLGLEWPLAAVNALSWVGVVVALGLGGLP